MPLLSISMIFGGMRFGDVVMYLVSALNVLFFAASLGLFASAICWDKKRANALGMLILMFFWMGLPMLALLLPSAGAPQWLSDAVARLSLNLPSMGVGFQRLLPSPSAWWSFVWTHMLAWALIGLTVWCLPRRWQDEPPRKRRALREAWKAMSLGTPAARLKLRRRLLDRNAFMWLASRDRWQAVSIWIASIFVIGFFGFNFFSGTFPRELLIVMAMSLAVVQQMFLSAAAGVQLLREFEQGTLEMVLSTPLSADEVIGGQLAAARRYCRTAFALTFLLLWVGLLWLVWNYGFGRLLGVTVLVVYSGLFVLQFYALGWVGMWFVVTAPDPKRAGLGAFFCLTMLPAMMFGMIVASVQLLNWLTGTQLSAGPELLFALLFILAFGNCVYWLRRAKRELPTRLRLFAFRRYGRTERQTIFGQIGRLVGRLMHRASGASTGHQST